MVRGSDDGLLVLDDQERVSLVPEGLHDAEQAADVTRVEADARLVHDEERVHKRRTEACGEVDPHDLPAREGAGGTVEREIPESDRIEISESGNDLTEKHHRALIPRGQGKFPQKPGKASHGGGGEFREGHRALPERQTVNEGLGLESSAVTGRAGLVGAIAAQEDPHVHLVGPAFHPPEKAVDAVPEPVLPEFLAGEVRVALALDHEPAVGLGEFFKGKVYVDVAGGAGLQEILLAFPRLPALEGAYHAPGNTEGAVGHHSVVVDPDDTSEAPALRAGSQGIIETEESR